MVQIGVKCWIACFYNVLFLLRIKKQRKIRNCFYLSHEKLGKHSIKSERKLLSAKAKK